MAGTANCLLGNDGSSVTSVTMKFKQHVADGGGEVSALAEPMFGRARVLRLFSKLYEANRSVTTTKLGTLNLGGAIAALGRHVEAGEW